MTPAMDAAIAAAAGLCAEPDAPLAELRAAWRHYTSEGVRVAVVGPFNHGKSTLLNALLGTRALPVDVVPSTGGVITLRHGTVPETRVVLAGGETVSEPGFDLLRRFALLDDARRMQDDVTAVELRLPHPLLARGVTLLDLPGTNDRHEQDALVRETLLSVDLVVYLLNARQLFTLEEQTQVRTWLLDRGISEMVFVLNFLNLVEPEDRERVWQRAVDAAVGLTGEGAPPLHRVDALIALRARTSGDDAALEASGLPAFQAVLEGRIESLAHGRTHRAARVRTAASRLAAELESTGQALAAELGRLAAARAARAAVRRVAAEHDRRRVDMAAARARDLLTTEGLQRALGDSLASALAYGGFDTWRRTIAEPVFAERLRTLNDLPGSREWSGGPQKSFFPTLPGAPYVSLPDSPDADASGDTGGVVAGMAIGAAVGSAIPLVGTFFGGLVGGLAAAARAGARENERTLALERHEAAVASARERAAWQYLAGMASSVRQQLYEHAARLKASLAPRPEPASAQERALAARAEAVCRACAALQAAAAAL
jgi:Dynamin family